MALPMLLTIKETTEQLGLSRAKVNRLIKSGELDSITIGRARRIPSKAVEEFIAERLELSDSKQVAA